MLHHLTANRLGIRVLVSALPLTTPSPRWQSPSPTGLSLPLVQMRGWGEKEWSCSEAPLSSDMLNSTRRGARHVPRLTTT